MKLHALILIFVLGIMSFSEANAQHRRYDHRRYRYAPRPYVRIVPRFTPRIFIPAPSFGFSWGYGTRIYVTPPPIIIGRGSGWRHYHPRGYDCNERCHRWSDDTYYNNQNRGYRNDDDRRNDNNQDNRRYEDNDRYYNNRQNVKPSDTKSQPKTYNTDEDSYDEDIETT